MKKKIILCGYFSLNFKANTVGDLMVLSELQNWLEQLDYEYDVVTEFDSYINNAIHLNDVDPQNYVAMIFVCGPLVDFDSITQIICRFEGIKKIAINVSLVDAKAEIVNLFDCIIPRDSDFETNLDLSINRPVPKVVPVFGLIYVGAQKEYELQKHSVVEEVVSETLESMGIASVQIDTKLPFNKYGLHSSAEIVSVISKMDTIITTRLHGAILALKARIPFLAIDPISKGAKVSRQIDKIGWPYMLNVDNLTCISLRQMIEKLLSKDSHKLIDHINETCYRNFIVSKESLLIRLSNELKK